MGILAFFPFLVFTKWKEKVKGKKSVTSKCTDEHDCMTALLIVAIWIYHRTAHHISPLLLATVGTHSWTP